MLEYYASILQIVSVQWVLIHSDRYIINKRWRTKDSSANHLRRKCPCVEDAHRNRTPLGVLPWSQDQSLSLWSSWVPRRHKQGKELPFPSLQQMMLGNWIFTCDGKLDLHLSACAKNQLKMGQTPETAVLLEGIIAKHSEAEARMSHKGLHHLRKWS